MNKLFNSISEEALNRAAEVKPDLTRYLPADGKAHASISFIDKTDGRVAKSRYLVVNEEDALEIHASLINYNLHLENSINDILSNYTLQEREYRKQAIVGVTIGYCDIEVIRQEELVS